MECSNENEHECEDFELDLNEISVDDNDLESEGGSNELEANEEDNCTGSDISIHSVLNKLRSIIKKFDILRSYG